MVKLFPLEVPSRYGDKNKNGDESDTREPLPPAHGHHSQLLATRAGKHVSCLNPYGSRRWKCANSKHKCSTPFSPKQSCGADLIFVVISHSF